MSLQPIDRFWRNLECWCVSTLSALIDNKISLFQKYKMAVTAILKIRKIAITPQQDDRFWRYLARWWVRAFQTLSANEISHLKIQDGGVRHFEKLKNLNIFIANWPILPKFDMLMSLDPLDPVSQKMGILKIKDDGADHFENWKTAISLLCG